MKNLSFTLFFGIMFIFGQLHATVNISSINKINSSGAADSNGKVVNIKGIVSSTNLNSKGLQFAFYDSTGNIMTYSGTKVAGYGVTLGDSLEIDGKLNQYSGLLEVNITGLKVINSGNRVKSPIVITALGEQYESNLVTLQGYHISSGAIWKTTPTMTYGVFFVNAAGTDSFSLRIAFGTTVASMAAPNPKHVYNITGIATQYDPTSPFDQGYEFYPRDSSDFKFIQTAIEDENTLKAPILNLYPNPATESISLISDVRLNTITVLDNLGRNVLVSNPASEKAKLDISGLVPGLYFVKAGCNNGASILRFEKF